MLQPTLNQMFIIIITIIYNTVNCLRKTTACLYDL